MEDELPKRIRSLKYGSASYSALAGKAKRTKNLSKPKKRAQKVSVCNNLISQVSVCDNLVKDILVKDSLVKASDSVIVESDGALSGSDVSNFAVGRASSVESLEADLSNLDQSRSVDNLEAEASKLDIHPDSDMSDAEEIREMEEKSAELLKAQEKLAARKHKAHLKAKLQAIAADNDKLEAECKNLENSSHKPPAKPPKSDTLECNMNILREMKELEERAQQRLKGIDRELDPDYYSDSSSDDSSCSSRRRGKAKKKRSGREVKAFDNVKVQLVWPHTQLRFQYMNNKTKFASLDLALLFAGETQHILANSPPADEVTGRLKLVQLVAYHSKSYQWQACLNFFGAVLLEVERGLRTWSDCNFQETEASTLYQYPIPKKASVATAQSDLSATFFCRAFNQGQCSRSGDHDSFYRGQTRKMSHICAKCWIVDKTKKTHRETSDSCPHKSTA